LLDQKEAKNQEKANGQRTSRQAPAAFSGLRAARRCGFPFEMLSSMLVVLLRANHECILLLYLERFKNKASRKRKQKHELNQSPQLLHSFGG